MTVASPLTTVVLGPSLVLGPSSEAWSPKPRSDWNGIENHNAIHVKSHIVERSGNSRQDPFPNGFRGDGPMSRQRLWLVCGFSVGVAIAGVVGAERSSATMTAAASRWLTSLSPEQREKAVFALASDERSRWHYIPATMFPRKGLPFKDMTEAQRGFAHDLLKAGLSQR